MKNGERLEKQAIVGVRGQNNSRRPSPSLDIQALHVSYALDISPVVSHEIAPVLEARNLNDLEVLVRLALLDPQ